MHTICLDKKQPTASCRMNKKNGCDNESETKKTTNKPLIYRNKKTLDIHPEKKKPAIDLHRERKNP
jgi:hypothetical protein